MGKILLIDRDENFLELARLSLEEKTEEEVITARTSKEAIEILKKGNPFMLVISDNQKDTLLFMISQNSTTPFLYFCDDKKLETPFTPLMFIGIWKRSQFSEMCKSIIHLLSKKRK